MKLGRIDLETTANIGTIHGGEATNVVPDCVEIEAEARSRNDARLLAQIGHMTQCLEEGAAEVGGRADIKVSRHYSSFKLSEADPVVQIACKAVRRAGLKPQTRPGGGGSDANIFNALGIPSVVMSVGYENIHTNEEQISVSDLVDTYRTAVALVQEAAERVQE
jgi:tripeptide aminopeptidase